MVTSAFFILILRHNFPGPLQDLKMVVIYMRLSAYKDY